jgi:hypothetical protein
MQQEGWTMPRITETVQLGENADLVWQQIGRFGSVGRWHPMLSKVEADGEGAGALRTAEGKDGSRQVERLLSVAPEQHAYRYTMVTTPMPVRDYVAELGALHPTDRRDEDDRPIALRAQMRRDHGEEPMIGYDVVVEDLAELLVANLLHGTIEWK